MTTSNILRNAKVLVTGGHGFLGSHAVDALHLCGASVATPSIKEFDLRLNKHVEQLYDSVRPNIVIHLAATVGGLQANITNPGQFFYDNMKMGMELLEVGRHYGLQKFVQMGSACEYPRDASVPLREEDLWSGYPEATNAPYGIAKKALLVQGQAYRKQYGMPVIHLLSTNLYGPRDNFNPSTSHSIPAIIRKIVEAKRSKQQTATMWGTGGATRDFLFVRDAVHGILLATQTYNDESPVNLGSGREASILEVATLVKNMVGFEGELVWDASKPTGQPRRLLDTTRAEKFGFRARTSLEEGLQETINWYEER